MLEDPQIIIAVILFVATYVCLFALPQKRAVVALISAALYIVLGILPVSEIWGSINFNALLMIAGIMGLVSLFVDSRMPARLGDWILSWTPNVMWAVVLLSLLASAISIVVDNVATALLIAPVALAVAIRLEEDPVPIIISIAVAANLNGAATLVGDTTSVLLAGAAGMDFTDFFVFHGKPSMFFVTELGAFLAILVLLFLFRKEKEPVIHTPPSEWTQVTDYFPTILMVADVVLLIAASFIPGKPPITNGLICVVLMVIGMIHTAFRTRSARKFWEPVRDIDGGLLLLLLGLFLVIGAIEEAGVIDAIAALFVRLSGDNLFLIYSLIVWVSVLCSAFIDNIPYVAAMLPVVHGIAQVLGIEPYVLYFGLLTGATLGGNLSPVGASANITAIDILEDQGYEVENRDFFRIGVPLTLVAVISGYLFVWFVWGV